MLNAKNIQDSSVELREFLELSCLYLSAVDEQFTGAEQGWIDTFFGEGTADRFISSFPTTQWDQVFSRINELAGIIPPHEMQLVSDGIEDFLKQLLSVDGFSPQEEYHLREFLRFLTEIGIQINQTQPELSRPLAEPAQEQPVKENAPVAEDPLALIVSEINMKLNEPVPPVIVDNNSSIQLRRIDEYPKILAYYQSNQKQYGPYVFERAITYDFENVNPLFRFEGETIWHSHDAIKTTWVNCYASSKQVQRLQKAKVQFDPGTLTFKQACWALEKIKEVEKEIAAQKPATKANLKKLDDLGIKYKKGITRAKVEELIHKHHEKEHKEDVKKAKEMGLDVDAQICPYDLESLLESPPSQELLTKLANLNSTLKQYDQRPFRIKNMSADDAEFQISNYEDGIEWAMDHSEHTDGTWIQDVDEDWGHFQNRNLTAEELSELTKACMKKVHKMIKDEKDFTEEEKIPCIKKVAKGVIERA